MRLTKALFGALALTFVAATASAAPIQLISNGNFEAGAVGWTVTDLAPGSGSFFFDVPGSTVPLGGQPTLSTAANGAVYAVSAQTGPGTHALSQSFSVAPGATSVILAFDMFVNNYAAGVTVNPAGLTHLAGTNQHGRVDILSAGSGAFDTGATVLGNFFLGASAGPNPHPFTSYLFDITALVGGGGSFVLRFAESDTQNFFNVGVDNVSILAEAVPEPATLALLGTGLLAIGFRRYRARR